MVRVDSQKHIDFALNSPFGGGRAGRCKRKNAKYSLSPLSWLIWVVLHGNWFSMDLLFIQECREWFWHHNPIFPIQSMTCHTELCSGRLSLKKLWQYFSSSTYTKVSKTVFSIPQICYASVTVLHHLDFALILFRVINNTLDPPMPRPRLLCRSKSGKKDEGAEDEDDD